jgi:PAS domain S-box-containing protein
MNEPFGTLYDTVTKVPLRSATPEEYEATRQSVIRGDRGIFSVGDVERYVSGSTPAGSLNLARFTPLMLTSIIELLPIGVAVATDGTATTIVGNRRFEEMLGLPAGRNVSLTAPKSERPTEFRVLVDGAEVDDADLPFQRAMRTGEPVSSITVDVVRAGGIKIPVEMSAAPLRDEYGRVVGGVGVFCRRDDRDAAIVAARLRRDLRSASGGWYQAITNALPGHVWACKGEGAAWYYNDRATAYCGRSSGELLGIGWLTSVHPDDRSYVKLAWKIATASGGAFEAEFRLRRIDGIYRWFHARGQPVVGPDGDAIDWFGTSTDIDDVKRETAHALIVRAIVREISIDQNVEALVEATARHCLQAFASFCIFDVYDRDFGFKRLTFVDADPSVEGSLHDAVLDGDEGTGLDDLVTRAMRERKTQVYRPDESPGATSFASGTQPRRDRAPIGHADKIVTPVLRPGGELIGLLTFGGTQRGGSRIDAIDVAFAEEIACLLSATFNRSRGMKRAVWRHRTVENFVRSASPVFLPTTDEIVLDAVHAAGREQRNAGASWYDAIWISPRKLILSSGKVSGSGAETALAMTILPQTLRAAAFVKAEPGAVMGAAEKVLRNLYPGRCAAVFFGIYDASRRELRYTVRGHPRPLLRLADGSTSGLPGTWSAPLGFGETTPAASDDHRVQMAPGALLVLHTETFPSHQQSPDEKLNRDAIEAIEQLHPQRRPASALLDSLCGAAGCPEDIAVLTALFR